MSLRKFMLLCVVLIIATGNLLVAGETVAHPQLGLRLTVPDGFVKDQTQVRGDVIHAFQRPPIGERKIGTFILISQLKGVLGREKLDIRDLPPNQSNVKILTENWKEFDIDVIRLPEEAKTMSLLTLNAQVPLKPLAIQISVFGEAVQEEELRSILQSVLRSLDGQTNWLTEEQRASKLGTGITKLAITAGVILLIIAAIWGYVGSRKPTGRRNSRRAKDRE